MARQFDNSHAPEGLRAQMSAPPAPAGDAPKQTDEQQVVAWLRSLQLLIGVPFHYLVPNPSMLPPESIRFFQVDQGWIQCLVDGAYSIASGPATHAAAAAARPATVHAARAGMAQPRADLVGAGDADAVTSAQASGFVLRSSLVSGWPGMEVTAYGGRKTTLPILRLERVSPTVLLGIFAGVIERLDLREPSEGLHFGVTESKGHWTKQVRYADSDASHPIGSYGTAVKSVTMRGTGETRVVEMSVLARALAPSVWVEPPSTVAPPFTAAEFALEMIEGVDVASFALGGA